MDGSYDAPRAGMGAHVRLAEHAARVIEGERYARAYLGRLQGGIAQPGELSEFLSGLTGEMLDGACRVIEKCLGGPHA